MSDATRMQGRSVQGQPRLHYFPPYPSLTLQLDAGILLILPQSMTTHALERFQINPHGRMARGPGAYQLAWLNAEDGGIARPIRDFYNNTRHGGASRLTDQEMIAWLQAQVKDGRFAAFWFQREAQPILMNPAAVAPVPAPAAAQNIAQWSLRQKIIAMFMAVPSHLAGSAKAQFEAFLTPQNLALLTGFFALIAAVQAAPVADAVVDAMLTGLAWAMYGWAGLVAVRDLIEAIIKAGRAQSQADINQAAEMAASALAILGVTLFLKRLTDRVKVNSGAGPKQVEEPEPALKSTAPASTAPDPPAALSPAEQAKAWQSGGGKYPQVDNWQNIILKKGTIVYGGTPGQSNFYTTKEAMQTFGSSQSNIFGALQVAPHPDFGFRPEMTAYEITEDTPAATSTALANSQISAGGAQQFFIPNYSTVLKPLFSVPLSP